MPRVCACADVAKSASVWAAERVLVMPLWRPVCLLVLQHGFILAHAFEYLSALRGETPAADGRAADGVAAWSGSLASALDVTQHALGFSKGYVARLTLCMLAPFWLDLRGEEQKAALLAQLRCFAFDRVQCRESEDRRQVRLAIEELYGQSETGFVDA